MGDLYHANMSDGSAYRVTTTLKQRLLDGMKDSISGIVSGVVVGRVHKGRK